jgi:hypothetical protein
MKTCGGISNSVKIWPKYRACYIKTKVPSIAAGDITYLLTYSRE